MTHKVPELQDEKVLETHFTESVYKTLLNCTLKDGEFYVMWILPQF